MRTYARGLHVGNTGSNSSLCRSLIIRPNRRRRIIKPRRLLSVSLYASVSNNELGKNEGLEKNTNEVCSTSLLSSHPPHSSRTRCPLLHHRRYTFHGHCSLESRIDYESDDRGAWQSMRERGRCISSAHTRPTTACISRYEVMTVMTLTTV